MGKSGAFQKKKKIGLRLLSPNQMKAGIQKTQVNMEVVMMWGVISIKVKISIVFKIIKIHSNRLYLSISFFQWEEERGERVSVIRTVHSECQTGYSILEIHSQQQP